MAFDYQRFADLTLKQIEDKGRTVQLIYKENGQYNPASDTVSKNYESSISVKALVTSVQTSAKENSLIRVGDRIFTIAAAALENSPSTPDLIEDESGVYSTILVENFKPGDTDIFYRIYGRK